MIQTFDFLYRVWESEELLGRILGNLEKLAGDGEEVMDIGVYSLVFDFGDRVVRIGCNDPGYVFYCKIPRVEISFEGLAHMIRREWDEVEGYTVI